MPRKPRLYIVRDREDGRESTSEESSVEKENPDDEIVVMPKRRKANTTSQESEDNSDKEEPKSKRTRRHKKRLTVEKGKPKSKLLRKEERDTICQELNDTDVATTLQELVCIIKEQAVSHPYIIQLLDELIRNDSLCQELAHFSVYLLVQSVQYWKGEVLGSIFGSDPGCPFRPPYHCFQPVFIVRTTCCFVKSSGFRRKICFHCVDIRTIVVRWSSHSGKFA